MFDCSLAKQGYSIQTNTVWWVLAEGSSLPHTVYTEYSVAFPIPGPRVEPRRRALPVRGRDGDPERQAQPRQHDLDEDPGRLHGPRGAARQGRRGIPPLHAGTGILSQPPEEARSLLIKGGKEIIVDWVVKNMQHFKMIETEKISPLWKKIVGKKLTAKTGKRDIVTISRKCKVISLPTSIPTVSYWALQFRPSTAMHKIVILKNSFEVICNLSGIIWTQQRQRKQSMQDDEAYFFSAQQFKISLS